MNMFNIINPPSNSVSSVSNIFSSQRYLILQCGYMSLRYSINMAADEKYLKFSFHSLPNKPFPSIEIKDCRERLQKQYQMKPNIWLTIYLHHSTSSYLFFMRTYTVLSYIYRLNLHHLTPHPSPLSISFFLLHNIS